MRRACTFALKGTSAELISGPEVPLPEQSRAFKAARGAGAFGDAEALELWVSNGSIRRTKFKPVPTPEIQKPKKIT